MKWTARSIQPRGQLLNERGVATHYHDDVSGRSRKISKE
jgi:hypothetical protein